MKTYTTQMTLGAMLLACALGAVTLPARADDAPAISTTLLPALMTANAEKGLLLGVTRAGQTLVAVGGNGVIVLSTDGRRWQQVQSNVDIALTNVAFANASVGWAVGHDAMILGTLDGGKTWKVQNFEPALNSPLFAIQPLDEHTALAVGAFGLVKMTQDGGATWTDVKAAEINGESLHINAVTRLANGKLLAAGERGLLSISDDGRQWRHLASAYEGSFFGVLPWGAQGAVAFGMRGNVYVTPDAEGQPWSRLDVGTTASFFGGETLDDGTLLLTGAESRVITIDAGCKITQIDTSSIINGQPATLTGAGGLGKNLVVVGETGARTLTR